MCVQQMDNKFYLIISQQNDVGFLFIYFSYKNRKGTISSPINLNCFSVYMVADVRITLE